MIFSFHQVRHHPTSVMTLRHGLTEPLASVIIGSNILPPSCSTLDFREEGEFPSDRRRLQYEGERCDDNVLEVASQNPEYSTFVSLVEAAGLEEIFLCAGPYTLFVPTNEAFEALDPELLEELTEPGNEELLQAVLLYHVLPGLTLSSDLEPGAAETLQGESVFIGVDPPTVNDVDIVAPDTIACNGVIHGIDEVLIPPSREPDGECQASDILSMLDY